MELEQMRCVLAEEAMGWHLSERGDWYVIPEGRLEWRHMYQPQWKPDKVWALCGLVIEAMRAKGWRWEMLEFGDGSISSSLRRGPGEYATAHGIGEKEARMLAAVRALEATDE